MKNLDMIKNFISLFACFIILVEGFTQSIQVDVIFKDVKIFDGASVVENTNLVLKAGRVLDITKNIQEYHPDEIIEADGKTIVPALMNMHVHVWMPMNLQEAQKAGVFALVDLHSTDMGSTWLRKFRDSTQYAYFLGAGSGVTVPGRSWNSVWNPGSDR